MSRLHESAERLLGRDTLWAVILVAVLTPILSLQECGLPAPVYQVGEVAAASIKAPWDIDLIDERATRELLEAEREASPPVYDLVVDAFDEQRQRLADLFSRGREALDRRRPGSRPDAGLLDRLREALPASQPPIPDEGLSFLVRQAFSPELEAIAARVHSAVMQGRIVSSREELPRSGPIVVRNVAPGAVTESILDSTGSIRDMGDAREALRERISREAGGFGAADRRALATALGPFVGPNLTYSASATEARREQRAASLPKVFTRIPRGRIIVREGELFTREDLDILSRMKTRGPIAVDWRALAGNAVLLSLLVLFMHRYVRAHQRGFRRVRNLYSLVLLTSLLVTVGAWVGIFIADSVADRIAVAPYNDPTSWYWALPVSAGAMLITLLANGRVATVASAFIAMLFGLVMGWSAPAMLFALVSSFAAIYGISKYERRSAVLKAAGIIGIVNVLVVFAIDCVRDGFSQPTRVLLQMGAAALGGALAAPVVSFSLPIMEWLFNVLTDIRLLELSNLDNKLLRRLSMEAPGTYNHSIIVGTLAEQAAEEIGAHALLCRVAAYYHDIGKISRPEYFVENMRDGANRHDRLSPRMSSLIIANHVKEGLRLAEEHNLPRQIRDIIPQHHGTRLITFFYRKAEREEDPDVPELAESDYRYPGPKPQSREAAIFMMADSVEAAARTVEEPTPARFEEVIGTVTNSIILDHQLDDCDLTFSDLSRIRMSFLKTLAAVHHHRITYPGFEFDGSRAKGPRAVEAE
ncbi:MAG TPA: HDIG domain-containing protein [Candidatus Polarisedimenticolia bacterium]